MLDAVLFAAMGTKGFSLLRICGSAEPISLSLCGFPFRRRSTLALSLKNPFAVPFAVPPAPLSLHSAKPLRLLRVLKQFFATSLRLGSDPLAVHFVVQPVPLAVSSETSGESLFSLTVLPFRDAHRHTGGMLQGSRIVASLKGDGAGTVSVGSAPVPPAFYPTLVRQARTNAEPA